MSISHLNNKTSNSTRISVDENTVEALRLIAGQFPGRAVFETTFSPEDQVLTHLIFEYNIPVRVFARSGKHPYEILRETVDHYGKAIEISFLQSEQYTRSFADQNPEQVAAWETNPRIAPLNYVLESKHVALSSRRKEPLESAPLSWDEAREKFVFSPLIYWTDNQIYAYILDNEIPHSAGTVPALIENETTSTASIPGWSGSFRKYLPQYSIVSGSFNIAHQIAAFFRLPQIASIYVPSGN